MANKIDSKNVFLFSVVPTLATREAAGPIETQMQQQLVIAPDIESAYATINAQYPKVDPIGCASLHQYETAIRIIRAALENGTGIPVLRAIGL